MREYLDKKAIKQDVDLLCFPSIQINFDWQSIEERNNESGVFLMMNMVCYDGELYESKLRWKVYHSYYGAEMVATLILADINLYRGKVLDRVKQFVEKQQNIQEVGEPVVAKGVKRVTR